MPDLDLSSVPCRAGQVVDEVMGDEAVLLLSDRKEIKILNELGTKTWGLIDGNRSVKQIAEILSEEYEVEVGTVLSDTLAFLNEILRLGIIVPRSAASRPNNRPVRP